MQKEVREWRKAGVTHNENVVVFTKNMKQTVFKIRL